MQTHQLLATGDVQVAIPQPGDMLQANSLGIWAPVALSLVALDVGTPATLDAALTTLTIAAPTVPDYAIQDVTDSSPFGFADAEEARTVLSVLVNLQTRLAQLETKLQALGIIA